MKDKTCLLVLGGEIKDTAMFRQRVKEAAQIFAADSGARHMRRAGILPDVIYGDLDSLSPEELRYFEDAGCRFVVSPAEKNDTDGILVLKEALRAGYKDVRIWGALGGRADHSYANIMLLQYPLLPEYREMQDARGAREKTQDARGFSKEETQPELPDVVIEDRGMRIFLGKPGQWLEGKPGDYLSLFALSQEVKGFQHIGLKYQPEGGRFISGFPLGISNEFMQEKVWIHWREGTLLCMQVDRDV